MIRLDIPDDLALSFAEEPVLDLYAIGPWRIPDGFFESLGQAVKRATADERIADWEAQGDVAYRRPTNGIPETLKFMLGFLFGACAIRSGYWGEMVWQVFDPFLANPPAQRRPSWNYLRSQDGAWRPPGWTLTTTAGDDPERRAVAFDVLRSLVDVFEEVEPVAERRSALARLVEERRAHRPRDLEAPVDTLPDEWARDADVGILLTLPELGGPAGYLAWVVDGFTDVHPYLCKAVGDGDEVELAVAQLLLAAGLQNVPPELGPAIGADKLAVIEEHHRSLRANFVPETWRDVTARWLVRATIRGELAACRAWLDMAMRLLGAANGVPARAMLPRDTVWVPVQTFEWNVRTLLASRPIPNALGGRFPRPSETEAVEPKPALPTANPTPAPVPPRQIVGQPDLSAALADSAGPKTTIRILVAGPAGSGKGLAVDAVQDLLTLRGFWQLPIWVPGSMVAERNVGGALDLLRFEVARCNDVRLLVLDGLDEMLTTGEASREAGDELLRLLESHPLLHVVALCDPGGDAAVFAANPLLARAFRVVRTADFDEQTFGKVFEMKVHKLGGIVDDATVERAARVLAGMRPFRNLRNGHLVSAAAAGAVERARARTGEERPRVEVEDLPEDVTDQGPAEDPFVELDELVGLKEVKQEVRLLAAEAKAERVRRDAGVEAPRPTRHFAFTGNPGTAKTTVARLLARIYQSLDLLSGGHLVEVSRTELVGRYIGHTAPLVRAAVERALGGVLFIDEAYALAPVDHDRDFGHEAIATLVKLMEDHRDDLVVIVAGYEEDMDRFLSSNPGLASRFARRLRFPDYGDEELLAIFRLIARKAGVTLGPGVEERVAEVLAATPRGPGYGNGRHARMLFERTMARQALRITASETVDPADIRLLLADDVPAAETPAPDLEASVGPGPYL